MAISYQIQNPKEPEKETMMKRSKWSVLAGSVAGLSCAVALSGAADAGSSGAPSAVPPTGERPAWVDATGAINTDLMPSRIKIGSDLFPEGYGLLDSAAFKIRGKNGPFDVFAPSDPAVVANWYYHGIGIVPVGTAEATNRQRATPVTTAVAPSTAG